jgi:hypothetical protein
MNCSECHRVLPESLEGQRTAELEAHLTSCVACSELVEDLNVIARQAAALREADEPSPRVWNMIEAELRRDGVIHPPRLESCQPGVDSVGGMAGAVCWLSAGAAFLLNRGQRQILTRPNR